MAWLGPALNPVMVPVLAVREPGPSDTYPTRRRIGKSPDSAFLQVKGHFWLVDVKGLEPLTSRV